MKPSSSIAGAPAALMPCGSNRDDVLTDPGAAPGAVAPARHRSLGYMPALDGIRGIGVVCMMLYHGEWQKWMPGGYLWLSTFFTLSGFLITSLLLVEQDATGRIDLGQFWVRRLRRLMPAAILGVALAAAFVIAAGSMAQTTRIVWDGLSALFYFSNFRFMASGHSYWEMFSRPSPLQHYWSLSIEEQFYVGYPLLLLGVSSLIGYGRAPLRAILVLLAAASTTVMIALSLAGVPPARLYYGTDTRAAEFLVGAVLATVLVHGGEIRPWRGRGSKLLSLVSLAYVVAAIFLAPEDSPFVYRGGFALYAVAIACIVNAALVPGAIQAVLSLRLLTWAGGTSYGVYVYHWPIFLYLDADRTGLAGLPLLLLQITVTFVVAVASKRWIEQPIRKGTMLRGGWAALAAPVAAAAVTALLLFATTSEPAGWIAVTGKDTTEMPELSPPWPLGPRRVVVFGDSLGWNIGSGLKLGLGRHAEPLTVWNLAQYGCGLVRDSKATPKQRAAASACMNWPDFWEQTVDRFRPDVVLVVTGGWDLRSRTVEGWTERRAPGDPVFDDWLLSEYRLAVDIASSRGARVIWVNVPCVGPIPDGGPLTADGALSSTRISHMNEVLLPALVASRPRQVEVFDLFSQVCPGGRFVKSLDGITVARSDFMHLSWSTSATVARQLVTRFAGQGGVRDGAGLASAPAASSPERAAPVGTVPP